MTVPVVICSSAFGADRVHRQGQRHCAAVAAAAGAAGIEIRAEMMSPGDYPLATLGADIAAHGLFCVYSSLAPLFAHGRLNAMLAAELTIATALGARLIKVPLGQLPPERDALDAALGALGELLGAHRLQLAIENDQTLDGGRIAPLKRCLEACRALELPVAMTFDVGNWRWTDSDPREAARALGAFVAYVHCKGVEQRDDRLVARPPDARDLDEWRLLWSHFAPAQAAQADRHALPRAIEFPLEAEDDAALIDHAKRQVARLGALGRPMTDHEEIA